MLSSKRDTIKSNRDTIKSNRKTSRFSQILLHVRILNFLLKPYSSGWSRLSLEPLFKIATLSLNIFQILPKNLFVFGRQIFMQLYLLKTARAAYRNIFMLYISQPIEVCSSSLWSSFL